MDIDRRNRMDATTKGIPFGVDVARDAISAQEWNILDGDTATPVALLRRSAIAGNIVVMRAFCEHSGVSLAPHGKTTLSPELIAMQQEAGAWGITVATPQQAALMVEFGVRRIIVANEVVDPAALRWFADQLSADPALEIVWYVDSPAGLALAEQAFRGHQRRPRLLVELGHDGGRTGARSDDVALALAVAVSDSDRVDLAGVAGYEGTIGTSRLPSVLAEVTRFVQRLHDVFVAMRGQGLLATTRPSVVSAGGSMFFDVVANGLAPLADETTDVVLRSGCYLTHDHGLYQVGTPAAQPGWTFGTFEPALEVWGRVLSRPEPGLVLVDAGRRDVSHDAGLPVPLWHVQEGSRERTSLAGARVSALSDQHTFVVVSPESSIAVGDLIGLGVSHPCTTFDRWPHLMLVNDTYDVVGSVRSHL